MNTIGASAQTAMAIAMACRATKNSRLSRRLGRRRRLRHAPSGRIVRGGAVTRGHDAPSVNGRDRLQQDGDHDEGDDEQHDRQGVGVAEEVSGKPAW